MKLFISLIILLTMMQQHNNKMEEVVLGEGCFWCSEAIFKELNGIHEVTPGYAGGSIKNPTYDEVCTGETGHAEVVKIKYDPETVPFEKILEVFFSTHDPTSHNRQGADIGTQYRSVIFYTTEEQEKKSREIIVKLNNSKIYQKPIVTELKKLPEFYKAESYHQNYYANNKNKAYCQLVIQPKLKKFEEIFKGYLKK